MKKGIKKILLILLSVCVTALFCVTPVGAALPESEFPASLIPGGMPFGVKLFTKGAIVLGTTGVETASGVLSPAKDGGLICGDIIIRAGGREFGSAAELTGLISGSGGKPIVFAVMRGDTEKTVEITPVRELESGEYRIGVLVRDSTAGIGTVTYIDPSDGSFGGLGHGIYDSEVGVLMPLGSGAVVRVSIGSVVKSERNRPGELRGDFSNNAIGELCANTEQGVFGKLRSIPASAGEAIPVARRAELRTGKAAILTTLDGNEAESYEIEIEKIYDRSGNTKNFLIKVTDERLVESAGGIVQGMSGSPIIMDGKLVGAVTHVLINDPLRGYGICIENMLAASKTCFGDNNVAEAA